MRAVKISYAVFTVLLIAVILNSLALGRIIDKFSALVEESEENDMTLAREEFEAIYDEYKGYTVYISLTVNHGDLESIDTAFAEIIGAAKAGDRDAVIMIKSRLIDNLDHIRRLSGINIDSVF